MDGFDIHGLSIQGRVDELRMALKRGADVNQSDNHGASALHCAIAWRHPDAALVLLKHDADVLRQDGDGQTALHYAVEYKFLSVAEAIIEANSSVLSVSDRFGNQPLWTAVFNSRGEYGIVKLLLHHGADPTHKNNVDLSPIDMAQRFADNTLVGILESRGLG